MKPPAEKIQEKEFRCLLWRAEEFRCAARDMRENPCVLSSGGIKYQFSLNEYGNSPGMLTLIHFSSCNKCAQSIFIHKQRQRENSIDATK